MQHVVNGRKQVMWLLRRQGQDVAPARVIVFCEDEEAARRAAMPLRSGLWGEHTVSVLLPHGEEPIQVTQGCDWIAAQHLKDAEIRKSPLDCCVGRSAAIWYDAINCWPNVVELERTSKVLMLHLNANPKISP